MVASVVFVIFFVIPHGGGTRPRGGVSSVALLMGGRQAPLSELRRIDHNLGLNRPVWVQYGMYMDRLAHFDLGHDYYAGAPVWSVLKPAIPPTLSIAVGASIVWVVGASCSAYSQPNAVARSQTRQRWERQWPLCPS
ncbi:MAG: hypothetical protein M3P01_02985, partial [Actinomycetota bacterium]|nr:hypothetical protein [Actinomycetota bacterium]